VSVHWCMFYWTFVIPTIAELANTCSFMKCHKINK
jgi:hypothetical protein